MISLILVFCTLSVFWALRLSLQAKELQIYHTGSKKDVSARLHGPALLLGGGGKDVTEAMQAHIDSVRGCQRCAVKLDMVIIRSSGADGYHSLYEQLHGLNTMKTLVITDRETANSSEVQKALRHAELVFFAGGRQSRYVRLFKGTSLIQSVKAVYQRGGGIGGTSAGLAIQGSSIYDALTGSVRSAQALENAYHTKVSLTHDLFQWPLMAGIFTDSHFTQRDRLGRLLTFLARSQQETQSPVVGLGIDEATAITVNSRGEARVFGRHHAYLVHLLSPPPHLKKGQPLDKANYRLWRFRPGDRFDLPGRVKTPPLGHGHKITVNQGHLNQKPY